MGDPKLELGLCAMPKDHVADCLAYNSLKVCIFNFCKRNLFFVTYKFSTYFFIFMVLIIRVLFLARL
jgi:hypothetical protein